MLPNTGPLNIIWSSITKSVTLSHNIVLFVLSVSNAKTVIGSVFGLTTPEPADSDAL